MADYQGINIGLPPAVTNLIQQGVVERALHEGLFPALLYRGEAQAEKWEEHNGEEMFFTREGYLQPNADPAVPGLDPIPEEPPYEQYSMRLLPYNGAVDIHMPTATVTAANTFLTRIKQLGLKAAQSINRVARNTLFKAYISGQTVATTAIANTDVVLRVASCNGFRDLIPSIKYRPDPVSAANPLPIVIGSGSATPVAAFVIATLPDSQTDLDGPGTLVLAAAVGTTFSSLRTAIKSAYAPRILRPSGGDSVDGISASDTLTLQQVINAVSTLRDQNVLPHDDGTYHAHIQNLGMSQFFQDPVFQRLNQSLPEHRFYKTAKVDELAGVMYVPNPESPRMGNAGAEQDNVALSPSTVNGRYAKEIGGEVVNGKGVKIGRVIITGKNCLREKTLDENAFTTEAGTVGKIGSWDIVHSGVQVQAEGIRFIMRAPTNRLQDKIGVAYSLSTAFACPSDQTSMGLGVERYKRAMVLEYAAG